MDQTPAERLAAHAAPYVARLPRTRVPLPLREPAAPPTESRLQALWVSRGRPTDLALPDGTPVEILDPGRWNRAPGPDFRGALIAVGGALRRGDVELHLRPADWDMHGHAGDPAYAGLILHVAWFPGPPAKTLPPAVPTLVLRPFAERQGPLDFAALALPDSPAEAEALPRPCHLRLRDDPAALDALLRAAGHYRLHAKTQRLAQALQTQSPARTLHENLFAALGYRRNAEPMRRLARELPLDRLLPLTPLRRFALLAGHAGLLHPTRDRALWDLWWQTGLPPPLQPYDWDLRALRPQNHPRRRLAGAAPLLDRLDSLLHAPLDTLAKTLVEDSRALCVPLGLKGTPIGANRAHGILLNLIVPCRLALGTLDPERLGDLPGEDLSQPMRQAWHHLTASLRALPKDGLRQQGLLQIHADFCSNPSLTCATCPLATGT